MSSDFHKMGEKHRVNGEAVPFLMLIADQLAVKETITTYGITNVQRMQVDQWLDSGFRVEKSSNHDLIKSQINNYMNKLKQKSLVYGTNPCL